MRIISKAKKQTINAQPPKEIKDKTNTILKNIPDRLSDANVLRLINSGKVNSLYITEIKNLTDLPDEKISDWLNMNVKTYRSYKTRSSERILGEDLQEHVIMILALFKHGVQVFGSNNNFSRWLNEENFFFGQQKPSRYLKTINGIKFTDDRLTALEYGDNV